MKTLRLISVLLGLSVGFIASAGTKENDSSLNNVIFSPDQLSALLGDKVLIQITLQSPGQLDRILAVIKAAKLNENRVFGQFPEKAKPAKPKSRPKPDYPFEMRRQGATGEANSLVLVGADGKVQCVYCYAYTNPVFATAAGENLMKWKFQPARIGDQPVPVLLEVPIVFTLTSQ